MRNFRDIHPLLVAALAASLAWGCSASSGAQDSDASSSTDATDSTDSTGATDTTDATDNTDTTGTTDVTDATGSTDTTDGTDPPNPTYCGGLTATPTECGASEYCLWTLEGMCGAADAPGTCQPKPGGCTANYDPV